MARVFSPGPRIRRVLRVACAGAALWLVGAACASLGVNRSSAALTLLLGVLACAATGDRILAVLSPAVATIALSYYFINESHSLHITTMEGAMTFIAMVVTAFTGSHLAARAQRRAAEAIRRREEMERLQQLGARLLRAQNESEAASISVREIVNLFSLPKAVLRIGAAEFTSPPVTPSAEAPAEASVRLPLRASQDASLELFGPRPSAEVSNALANLLELVLDRARNFEERARIDAERRGDELRMTILNSVAHDFRTPLTSIKAAASALRASSVAIFEPDRELIEIIEEEADRLDAFLRESLAVARLESPGLRSGSEPCSIPGIVASVKSRLARYLDRRCLEIDLPDDLPPVPGDRFLIEQMLVQVVENAWKYSRPGARIAISAGVEDQCVRISVWNEGLRIPDDERARIFDKFYRGAGGRARTEGTGLGLAIARSIAEAHGGGIWLDDKPEGTGFRFLLPIASGLNGNDREPHHPPD